MAQRALAEGVQTVVATPRWAAGHSEPPLPFADCQHKVARLEAALSGALSIKLGFELQFSPQLPGLVARYGSMLTLGGKRHLLISLPAVRVPAEVEMVWREINRQGFSIIVAHPECNAWLRRDPVRLDRWVDDGITLQISAGSVAGAHGREVRRFALECLRQYEAHAVVASNARDADAQKDLLSRARTELNGQLGERPTAAFMCETPTAIINDQRAQVANSHVADGRFSILLRSLKPRKALVSRT